MSNNTAIAPAYILFFLFALSQSTESIFTTGLPQISEEFAISPGLAQLCSTVYFFGFATGILTLGRISDYIGRKPVIIFGLMLFLFTSIISFFADNIYNLLLLRFVQAFGASIGSVIAQAVARDSYKGLALSKLYASLAAGIAIMPALGSVIGGNIVEYFSWRYNFIYLFILIFIVLLLCFFKLPETNRNIGKSDTNKFWAIFKYMLSDRSVLCYGGIIGAFNGIMYSFYIEAPFIFITKLNIHPSNYGYLILMLSISGIIGSAISRWMQHKNIDGQIIIRGGIVLSVASCASFSALAFLWAYKIMGEDLAKKIIILPMLTQAMSFSIVMPVILRFSLENYSKVNGTAGSIFGFYYYIIVATINFITTQIHDETVTKFSIFCVIISLLSYKLCHIAKNSENDSSDRYKEH